MARLAAFPAAPQTLTCLWSCPSGTCLKTPPLRSRQSLWIPVALLQQHGFVLSAEQSSRLDAPGKGPTAYPDAPSPINVRAGKLRLLQSQAVPLFSVMDPLVDTPIPGCLTPSPKVPHHQFM